MKVDSQNTFDSKASPKPIFILGIMPRCGTNFLHNLVLLHPDCELAHPGEDFFLAHADLLVNYAETVYKNWNPKWRDEIDQVLGSHALCRFLGDGLISYLETLRKRKSTKLANEIRNSNNGCTRTLRMFATVTPSVNNLEFFLKIFPEAHLLILVRDGRSVVESGVKSFGWDYQHAMRRWALAARTVLSFDNEMKGKNENYLVIRYEDLYNDTSSEMAKILTFLGLDPSRYSFEKAANMSISGSSELKSTGHDIHWKLVDKPRNFNPLSRWQSWSRSKHERFNRIAGYYLEEFGYAKQEYNRYQFIWSAWNIILDKIEQVETGFRWRKIPGYKLFNNLSSFMFVRVAKLLEAIFD